MVSEKKHTIMCVDDEQDVLDSLFDTLMDRYSVKTVNDSVKALEMFKETDISLVITDQRMPEMEGTELLQEIHKIKPMCKKVLLTGYADINAAVDAINLGSVDKYFNKPWDADKLVASIEDLLEEFETDKFFENAIEQAEDLKKEVARASSSAEYFGKFLDSYLSGVCIVGDGGKISYVNKKGLELLKYGDLGAIADKDFKDVFSINESNKNKFLEKYLKKNASREKVGVKLADGSSSDIQASITFAAGDGGLEVSGIIFE